MNNEIWVIDIFNISSIDSGSKAVSISEESWCLGSLGCILSWTWTGLKSTFNKFSKKKVEQGDSGRPGYTSTSAESPHPTGLDCFPTVFSCPQNIPDHLFPGLVSTLFNEDKCEYILSKQIEFWMRKKYYCYWIREAVKNYLADFFR